MVLYQQGQYPAFEELYHRNAPKVFSYLKKRMPNQAEDLLQTVFLKLHQSRDRYDAGYPFLAWLFSITRNSVIDALRKKQPLVVAEAELEGLAAEPAVDDTQSLDLEAVLCGLPQNQQELLRMRFQQGLSFEEIGARLKLNEDSVRKRVSRIIQGIRKFLGGKNG